MEIVNSGDYVMYRKQDNTVEIYKCVQSNGNTDTLTIQRVDNGSNKVFNTTFRARTKKDNRVRVCRLWIQPKDTGYIDNEPCFVHQIDGIGETQPVVRFTVNDVFNTMYLNVFSEKFTFEKP